MMDETNPAVTPEPVVEVPAAPVEEVVETPTEVPVVPETPAVTETPAA